MRDITRIPVNHDLGVPRFVSRYAFDCTGTLFDLDLGVKVTRNVAQYPLHHVTYSATKFEVATSKGLGGDAFTRKLHQF